MKKVLFSINTEYHVLIITSLIEQLHSEPEGYEVNILITRDPNGSRFKSNLNLEHLNGEVVFLDLNMGSFVYDPLIKQTLERVVSKEYDKFIFFLEQTAVNQYIVNKLSSKGTTICLAPEGTKPYITISKAALPSRLKATFKNYQFYIKQKLKVNRFYLVRNQNGYLKETNEVWINHPNSYANITKKQVVPIELFNSSRQIERAATIFNFNIKNELPETDNILFYLNQWYVEFKVYDFEIKILEALLNKYPKKKIYIKLHPNTHQFQVKRLEQMERVVINRSTVPAELFIASLKNSIVFSFWSASLLIENKSCRFYWLHKLLMEQNLMEWWSIVNPTDHIQEVENLQLIEF